MITTPWPATGTAGGYVGVVSDVLVDVVVDRGGVERLHPGGAGLNLSVGLRDLGVPVLLAAPRSDDEVGRDLWRRIHAAGIDWLGLPGPSRTGRATSRRIEGEPQYHFSREIRQRHYVFDEAAMSRLAAARLLAVNSYPMEQPAEVAALRALARETGVALVLDPNVRPQLAGDPAVLRQGLLDLAGEALLVKLSTQDVHDLGVAADALVTDLLERGVGAVVLTRAAAGAEVWTARGVHVHVGAAQDPAPVVDTMGAGDAVLAQLIREVGERGTALDPEVWREVLARAMERAARVCRRVGGNQLKPAESPSEPEQNSPTSEGNPA
ncbi:MAG: PfkB family carbohydrate kinase [Propionibacteriaceae bacterium]